MAGLYSSVHDMELRSPEALPHCCRAEQLAECLFIQSLLILNLLRIQFDTALPWVPSNTPTKCDVNQMDDSQDMQTTNMHTYIHTDRQTETLCFI